MENNTKKLLVSPSKIFGTLAIPPSKSQTLRALLFGSLASGKSRIENVLDSPDTGAMIASCRKLGAEINYDQETAVIKGIGGNLIGAKEIIDAGNSGLVLRFASAVGSLGKHPVIITGDRSICHQRPMEDLLNGLRQLGVRTETTGNDGYAPLIVKGPMKPGIATVKGRDSQTVSALLIAAAFSKGVFEINATDPGERPWVELTLRWLDRIGAAYTNDAYRRYTVTGKKEINPINYQVPGDLSSCAFPVAAALVTQSSLIVENVDLGDAQGDKKLFDIFRKMGAEIEEISEKKQLVVRGGAPLKGIEVDINDFIDAIVVLSVVACFCKGRTVITNAAVAREKECDRISALAQELSKMGAIIKEQPDGLEIVGSRLHGAEVWSHRDHRIGMGLAIAGMGAAGLTVVQDSACIAKTYPAFVKDFFSINAQIEERS